MHEVCLTLMHPRNEFLINADTKKLSSNGKCSYTIRPETLKDNIFIEILHTKYNKSYSGSSYIKTYFFEIDLSDKKNWEFSQSYQDLNIFAIRKKHKQFLITFELLTKKNYTFLRRVHVHNQLLY